MNWNEEDEKIEPNKKSRYAADVSNIEQASIDSL